MKNRKLYNHKVKKEDILKQQQKNIDKNLNIARFNLYKLGMLSFED